MLKRLQVRNLALAENIAVEFEAGFNVITGETGAGKSILIGALGLLLGERADKSLIRTGAEQCSAEAQFELESPERADATLEALGLPASEEGQIILRRTLKSSGGVMCINDHAVTLQALKQLGDGLVDMHGPHDHQALFQPAYQREVLDAFGGLEPDRARYAEAHDRIVKLDARRNELMQMAGDPAAQMDMLEFRVKEIEQAALEEGEEERVREEQLRVGHAQRIIELSGAVCAALTENDTAAFTSLASVQRPLEELARLWPQAESWRVEASEISSRAQALSQTISSEVERMDADPARLEWLDQRLALYQKLLRKYGGSVAAAKKTLEDARARLELLKSRDEQLRMLDAERAKECAEREKRGMSLREKRKATAHELAEAITGELDFLGFPGSAFHVAVSDAEPDASGMDAIEYGFAPNVGEIMRPLRAIASSGEISRVMLAVKAVLAGQDRVPVLVFDEIDANLGGEMGHAVGRELAGVASRRQVICITHLPQVAAYGTTHWVVKKEVRDGRTYSMVARAEGSDREAEMVRMLGGIAASRATLDHARELLKAAIRGGEKKK